MEVKGNKRRIERALLVRGQEIKDLEISMSPGVDKRRVSMGRDEITIYRHMQVVADNRSGLGAHINMMRIIIKRVASNKI